MSTVAVAQALQGYTPRCSSYEKCRYCSCRAPEGGSLVCTRGGFFVRPDGGCKEFTAGPAQQVHPNAVEVSPQ